MLLVLMLLLGTFGPPDASPTASPAVVAPSTADDITLLRDSVRGVMAGSHGKVLIFIDQAKYLPDFDNIVHYGGISSDGQIQISASYDYVQPHKTVLTEFESSNARMIEAFVLGTMDVGAAGPKWKAYYDSLFQADAALPVTVNDRYQNRHAAATALTTTILALP